MKDNEQQIITSESRKRKVDGYAPLAVFTGAIIGTLIWGGMEIASVKSKWEEDMRTNTIDSGEMYNVVYAGDVVAGPIIINDTNSGNLIRTSDCSITQMQETGASITTPDKATVRRTQDIPDFNKVNKEDYIKKSRKELKENGCKDEDVILLNYP